MLSDAQIRDTEIKSTIFASRQLAMHTLQSCIQETYLYKAPADHNITCILRYKVSVCVIMWSVAY